ncbi:SDR family oxidoreductase [Cycloclasticus pugetii]|uniref:SDR family oxidoreductase n=1 Tax=Cycloclasticus pugetii TaxID=34068 RepID=UPI000371DB3E|nr:SDR family oxidoreductase [Cycloclasticus pugetii]
MYNNKVILLTGAGSGIGAAVAKELSELGAQLILVGRNQDKLETVKQNLSGQHDVLAADISSSEGRQVIKEHCEQRAGGIDILINNAGISAFTGFETMSEEKISSVIHINLTSTILLTQQLLPLLKAKPSAQIVNIGSAFASLAFAGFTVYSASKYGLKGFTEALRRELHGGTVDVRYFAPRGTDTPFNDENTQALNVAIKANIDTPEKVATEFADFLQSSKARHFVGWQERLFGRLNGLFPGLIDKALAGQHQAIMDCLPQADKDKG